MATLDFGLFGLDAMGGFDKEHCGLDTVAEFQDILGMSLDNTHVADSKKEDLPQPTSWEDDTDEFLQSMLTGSDLSPESQLGLGCSETVLGGLSDTSSDDSGMIEDQHHHHHQQQQQQQFCPPQQQ